MRWVKDQSLLVQPGGTERTPLYPALLSHVGLCEGKHFFPWLLVGSTMEKVETKNTSAGQHKKWCMLSKRSLHFPKWDYLTRKKQRKSPNILNLRNIRQKRWAFLPDLGQRGSTDDPLRRCLSVAECKWCLRYLSQGLAPDETRKNAEKHRIQCEQQTLSVMPKRKGKETTLSQRSRTKKT